MATRPTRPPRKAGNKQPDAFWALFDQCKASGITGQLKPSAFRMFYMIGQGEQDNRDASSNPHAHSEAEEWRKIPGWEGLYEVSRNGVVRGLARTTHTRNRHGAMERTIPARVMQPSVRLTRGSETCRMDVSDLVAQAFPP